MDRFTSKRRQKPTALCQYKENCYRKNPHHFMEYAHEHLDNIISNNNASDTADSYKIPDELMAQKSTILEQIKIINDLFPKISLEPQTKRIKPEEKPEPRPVADKKESDKKVVTSDQLQKALESSAAASSGVNNIGSKPIDKQSSSDSTAKVEQSRPAPQHNIHNYIKVVLPKGRMASKLEASHPYNYFLTAITSSPQTHTEPLTVTFQEILDPSLGELECSVQINFMVELGWLLGQYYFAGCLDKPMLILYGSETEELKTISTKKPQITAHHVQMGNPFATHHTKMMLLGYKDQSMRVVVSTANLYEDDWHNRTQGLWISDRLPPLPDGSDTVHGESPTQFRNELLKYLTTYKLPQIQPWLVRIRKCDFSAINVFLVTSVPGTHHETTNGYAHGHGRVSWLLSKYAASIEDTSPIVAQSSSLGSFGANPNVWLASEFVNSFRRDSQSVGLRKVPPIRVIYPSFNNVVGSHDGLLGGGCLPYGNQVNQKQPWLQQFLYQWKANVRHRNHAMPHIKTYARWTDKKLHWFVLTSANLSKAAWGSMNKSAKINVPLRINNYEAGVMFLPKFVTQTDYFSMDSSDQMTPVFPPLYDIPLTKYAIDDGPFLSDVLFSE